MRIDIFNGNTGHQIASVKASGYIGIGLPPIGSTIVIGEAYDEPLPGVVTGYQFVYSRGASWEFRRIQSVRMSVGTGGKQASATAPQQ